MVAVVWLSPLPLAESFFAVFEEPLAAQKTQGLEWEAGDGSSGNEECR